MNELLITGTGWIVCHIRNHFVVILNRRPEKWKHQSSAQFTTQWHRTEWSDQLDGIGQWMRHNIINSSQLKPFLWKSNRISYLKHLFVFSSSWNISKIHLHPTYSLTSEISEFRGAHAWKWQPEPANWQYWFCRCIPAVRIVLPSSPYRLVMYQEMPVLFDLLHLKRSQSLLVCHRHLFAEEKEANWENKTILLLQIY